MYHILQISQIHSFYIRKNPMITRIIQSSFSLLSLVQTSPCISFYLSRKLGSIVNYIYVLVGWGITWVSCTLKSNSYSSFLPACLHLKLPLLNLILGDYTCTGTIFPLTCNRMVVVQRSSLHNNRE